MAQYSFEPAQHPKNMWKKSSISACDNLDDGSSLRALEDMVSAR
jgi:hypothetical protein